MRVDHWINFGTILQFEQIQIVGAVIACEGVYEALMGKMQTINGPITPAA